MSVLELKWTDRILTVAQTPRRFLDFVIDGSPLYPTFGDVISALGWLDADESVRAVRRILLKSPPDFADDRTSIQICPECGDLGCGAISVVIERAEGKIKWRDFGYQNNYDEYVELEEYRNIGPFVFDADDYESVIKSALE